MMTGKVVIVTGGSSGMGKYMARKFANEGANVVSTGRDEQKLRKAKLELLETATGAVETIAMDVRDANHVAQMVEETVELFGRIDHLINNAAGNFVVKAE